MNLPPVSGHKLPDQNPWTKSIPDSPRQPLPDKDPLRVKYEIPGTLFKKHFIAFLKDVFKGLPYYTLYFSALTAWYNFILCAVPSCKLCFNDFMIFIENVFVYGTFSLVNTKFFIFVCERCEPIKARELFMSLFISNLLHYRMRIAETRIHCA